MIQVEHPTDRVNFTIVYLGTISIAFSYETIVGFRQGYRMWKVAENTWGPTTGKHLNWLQTDKTLRVPQQEVEALVYNALMGRGLADLEVAAQHAADSIAKL